MLLWRWFKAFQRLIHLESGGVARGGQKSNMASDIHLPCVEILQLHEFFARGAIRARAAIMFHQPGSLTVSAVRFGSICRSFGCPRLGCLPVLDPRDFGAHSRATPSAVAEWREL